MDANPEFELDIIAKLRAENETLRNMVNLQHMTGQMTAMKLAETIAYSRIEIDKLESEVKRLKNIIDALGVKP